MDTSALATGIKTIIQSITTVNTWIWGLFSDFLSMIMDNALIALPVLFAVLAGAIGLVVRVIRRFGVRGKRA